MAEGGWAVDPDAVAVVSQEGNEFLATIEGLDVNGRGPDEATARAAMRTSLQRKMSEPAFRTEFLAWMQRVGRPVTKQDYNAAIESALTDSSPGDDSPA